MDIDYNKLFNIVTLSRGENREVFRLGFRDQSELLRWFCNNKPELIGEVVCIPDCSFLIDYQNYCENKFERGK